jgi:hypothetical protein
VFEAQNTHILTMLTPVKKTCRTGRAPNGESTVIYRGIKIAPVSGKRSATAKAIRDALRAKSERESAHG